MVILTMKLEIFCSSPHKVKMIENSINAIKNEFNLQSIYSGELNLVELAYNKQRKQYDAAILLDFLIMKKKEKIALWFVSEDIYATGTNFIFGLAIYYKGAVLSTYRLTSDLITKEAIHEIGHVLGLEHCKNYCVMKFSNSIYEVKLKPSNLCENCSKKLKLG